MAQLKASGRKQGRQVFFALWSCQLASLLGSDIVEFALRVWTYQKTGSVRSFSLITLFTEAPAMLLAPFAGALVDRYGANRKLLLIASDLISALILSANYAVLCCVGVGVPATSADLFEMR